MSAKVLKPLKLGYVGSWRTKADERRRGKATWKNIRRRILERDNYTCVYCEYRDENAKQVNHIDGNPKNNADDNLETICHECEKINHSGFWAQVQGTLEVYQESKYNQNDIIRFTRELRQKGSTDEEIKVFLGLKNRVTWEEDLGYLSTLFGFISSRPFRSMSKPLLSEEEQKDRLGDRANS